MKLDTDNFSRIIATTPLVSIDLILRNPRGEVLLGWRRNRPAQNSWFVPGGRIRKEERIRDALARIARTELGVDIAMSAGRLLGVFDHLYEDNVFGIDGLRTHYVAIGYACELGEELAGNDKIAADDQHAQLRWWQVGDLLASAEVHPNTKLYFQSDDGSGLRCPRD